MSITLGNDAVGAMVALINAANLTGFTGRAYFYERPGKLSGEYIVVNHLPFVHREAVEEGIVNVNIHVPRLSTNEPDAKRLHTLASEVAALVDPRGSYLANTYIEFYADSRPVEDNDGTYYVNLQFKVYYNNLNY